MNDSADEPPLPPPSHTWARTTEAANLNSEQAGAGQSHPDSRPRNTVIQHARDHPLGSAQPAASEEKSREQDTMQQHRSVVDKKRERAEPASMTDEEAKAPLAQRFLRDCRRIIFCSWINVLLIFVPVGIVLGADVKAKGNASPVSPSVVFGVNCVAIIPLASLLAFATESVASKMGDTIGALLNVTFGNAVELIIFIIALVAGEIRIVQASVLGSILSNLLLILGMCFVFGGLRFREQLYNPQVSQMSACLLSLSVISLLLPTAFHASFSDSAIADQVVVKISRGTSVVLLLVYVLYLLFQLKSHAYMYASTPQHLIDEESHPGVIANMLDSGSSSDGTSSDNNSDTDSSSGSHTTAKRIRRVLRRKRRKSDASSKGTSSPPLFPRTNSVNTTNNSIISSLHQPLSPTQGSTMASPDSDAIPNDDEVDLDRGPIRSRKESRDTGIMARDFEGLISDDQSDKHLKFIIKKKSRRSKNSKKLSEEREKPDEKPDLKLVHTNLSTRTPPQVGFISEAQEIPDNRATPRPFNMRHLPSVRPSRPKGLGSAVFTHHQATVFPLPGVGSRPLATLAATAGPIRRTTSLPDMPHQTHTERVYPVSVQPLPHIMPVNQPQALIAPQDIVDGQEHLSKTSSILLLLVVTALVAVCAEFLVGSINYLVSNSGISQMFVGLIILPIVGNAAEHVTAVTVASKNKMDLAINVALGSSIQIALFVTPVMVLLGWILNKDMSLFFSLFETVSLFASAFIVNYLMIDGRSNYLEGALLIAAYIIIALAAFFYPSCGESVASGGGGFQTC